MDDAEFRRLHRQEIVDDRISGASQLARQALDSLAEFAGSCSAETVTDLRRACLDFAEALQYARPNMAPIYHLVQRWADRIDALPEDEDAAAFRRSAANIAQELSDASVNAIDQIAEHTARLINPEATVITHSLSTTVQATFRRLGHTDVRAIVTESRPGLEGRTQALHLNHFGVAVSFITDAQIGHFTPSATIALVGADTLLGDGAVVNKAGTYLLALAAHRHGIPFCVCCESFKQVPYTAATFDLEAVDPSELDAPAGRLITPYNVYFDITPRDLVDTWITEDGVIHANST
jgi:translation initiation factor 2B subunit (eIF-2B alpha/beta/delta family)